MIKNLSDIRRLSRVGKIHLGVKATARSGSEYPKAVDYFVVKADESTPESAAEAFKKVYGETPKELEVLFPVNSVNTFWDCFYKSYVRTATTGGKLICKGDGVSANRLNIETGEFMEIPCPGPEDCEHAIDKHGNPTGCRRVGTLQFLIPSVGILGVWQIDTGSFNGIVGINSDIDMIRSVTGGRIAMIPLILKVIPKKCNVEGKQSIIHHLRVEYRGTIQTLTALSDKLNKQRQLSYDLAPINPDEIPADLMPPVTLPMLGAEPKPAAQPAQDPQKPAAEAKPAQPAPVVKPEEKKLEAPAADLTALIAAEFERLKYPENRQKLLLEAFRKNRDRLLKTLKEAKVGK